MSIFYQDLKDRKAAVEARDFKKEAALAGGILLASLALIVVGRGNIPADTQQNLDTVRAANQVNYSQLRAAKAAQYEAAVKAVKPTINAKLGM